MEDELKHVIAQSLECPVCLNIFKDPKILSCSHTFCKACLDNLLECHGNEQKLGCPVCRADSQVPNKDVSQLQTNLALKSLIEDVANQHQVCTNCKSKEKLKAAVYCQDCGKYLCIICQKEHSRREGKNHEVVTMSKIATVKGTAQRYRKCCKHPKEEEECFCIDCRRLACFRCGVVEHAQKGHRVIEASVYESNHQKDVQYLKSKADKKRSCIQRYIDFIDEQKDLVNSVKKKCVGDINKAYNESVQQLTDEKNFLIDDVTSQTMELDTELEKMKKEAQRQIVRMDTVTNLVANGTKIPLEMDAVAAHGTLCQELQDVLAMRDPSFTQPRRLSNKGKYIAFKRNGRINEVGLGEIINSVVKTIALPTKDSMGCMAATPDSRMAVGCHTGGIDIYSADSQLQQTVLWDVAIHGIGFLSDGRCVVQDCNNTITLHTAEWDVLNVWFETLNHEVGGFGGLDVDSYDQIYISYRRYKKIQVFSPAGGYAIREIPYRGYIPDQITMFGDLLIICHGKAISMIDNDGNVIYRVSSGFARPQAAVTQDNRILIAWVNHGQGLVSIDEYNKELQLVKRLISDYKIEKSERDWYCLREFRSGEMAFCTPDRLYMYIFH